MNARTERILQIGLIAAFAVPLLAYAYLGIFNRFIADDFCVANKVIEQGLFQTVVSDYNTWFGRVSESFTSSLAALLGPRLSPLHSTILLITWFIGLVWVTYEIGFSKKLQRLGYASILTACFTLLATLAGSPQIYQSIYWLNSIYTYAASLALLPYIIAGILHVHHKRWLALLAICGLAFAAAAFSEPFAAVQTLIFAGWLAVAQAPRQRAYVLAALIGSLLAVVVLLAAPGNTIRQANFQRADSIVQAGFDAAVHAAAFIIASISSFSPGSALVSVMMPALLSYWLSSDTSFMTPRAIRIRIMMAFMAGFILITVFMFPGIFATRLPPPARSFIIPQFILVCSLNAVGFWIGRYLRGLTPKLNAGVILLIGVAILVGPVLTTLQVTSFVSPLNTFATEFDQREQIIAAAKARGETNLVVPPFTVDIAERVGLDTIGSDPAFWVNACAARYYELESLVAE